MLTIRTILSTFALASVMSAPVFASPHQYLTFSDFPAADEDCGNAIDLIMRSLKADASVTVRDSWCRKGRKGRVDMQLTVATANGEEIVTTDAVGEDDVRYHGQFVTMEACEADLDNQKTLFKAQTGLTPRVHYCYRERGTIDSFTAKVVGVGKPARRPWVFERSLSTQELGDVDTLLADVRKNLEAAGAPVFGLAITRYPFREDLDESKDYFDWRITVRYYADHDLNISSSADALRFLSFAECQSELTRLAAVANGSGYRVLGRLCERDFASKIVDGNLIAIGSATPYRQVPTKLTFRSLKDCQADQVGVDLKADAARKLVGWACTRVWTTEGESFFAAKALESGLPTVEPVASPGYLRTVQGGSFEPKEGVRLGDFTFHPGKLTSCSLALNGPWLDSWHCRVDGARLELINDDGNQRTIDLGTEMQVLDYHSRPGNFYVQYIFSKVDLAVPDAPATGQVNGHFDLTLNIREGDYRAGNFQRAIGWGWLREGRNLTLRSFKFSRTPKAQAD